MKSLNNKIDNAEPRKSVSGGTTSPNKARDEFRHVQNDLDLMRNRVNLLRHQLQKEKDSIKKHRHLTQQVVQKKAEISKVNALVQSPPLRRTATRQRTRHAQPTSVNATTPTGRSTSKK